MKANHPEIKLSAEQARVEQLGDLNLQILFTNPHDTEISIDRFLLEHPQLILQIRSEKHGEVHLMPPPVYQANEDRKTIVLKPGEQYKHLYQGIPVQAPHQGKYLIRVRTDLLFHAEDNQLPDEWFEAEQTSSLPLIEILQPVNRKSLIKRLACWLRCLLRRIFRINQPCDRVLTGEVNQMITETVSNAPAGAEAWNNTFSWRARFQVRVDEANCRVTATVRVRLAGGAITPAQQTAWKQAIENKWSNMFKICCPDPCCRSCCPNGYTIVCELLYVNNNEHQVVNAGADTTNMGNWGVNDTIDVTHEYGHMLGMKEEYFTVDGVNYGAARQPGGNVMNNPANNPVAAHYELVKNEAARLLGTAGCQVVPVAQACR